MMSDLYVFMKLLTSSLSSDDVELILIEHKKNAERKLNYIDEIVRKMSDETVSFTC